MLHAPEVQKKALEEITRVVGTDRLPTLEDRPHLPYITAIVKETYRWELGEYSASLWRSPLLSAPVIPLGVPHRLMEDDVSSLSIKVSALRSCFINV
jgi:cytochrome P450